MNTKKIHPSIIIKEINKTLDEDKDKIYPGRYLFIKEQLNKINEMYSNQEDEIFILSQRLEDAQKPHCIKCGAGVGHDGKDWMNFQTYQSDGGRGPDISICPKCILSSEAVKDLTYKTK